MSQGYSFWILVKLIIVNTCWARSEAELFWNFSPAEGVLRLDLDLEVHLHLELSEDEGGLVPELVLDCVLGPGDDHTGPGVAVGWIVVSLQRKICLISIYDAVVFF